LKTGWIHGHANSQKPHSSHESRDAWILPILP
jgi:hypothetical protein